ncbi:MAG: UDP-3-O-[3-hydroxymyristoyl] N-acetylglucosamine deacetylase [Proteobacteria bacterium]|nr:MAG: UDP-3-O-[3-hydroxymyristoyl] N-acetylglucosamine deacetylase [Pseudomonadota bacterium]PIE19620.1 MAG: UDP-3-O-[3-hydroxymyristoyl] N-acetylglucosamine deacetylase [Pseudomonadota bacterium]
MAEPRLAGLGLHTGAATEVVLCRRTTAGITLWRRDSAPEERFDASLEAVVCGARRTTLRAQSGRTLSTVEHALAACAGLGRWETCIAVDGPELPIADGSALPYCELLGDGPEAPGRPWRVAGSFAWEGARGARYRLAPADHGRLSATSVFDHPLIGTQRMGWDVGDVGTFRAEIAPARTFGFVEELEALRRAGLIRGATLECALLFDADQPLGEPRFADEPGRHKLLDLIGDLALLGGPIRGVLEAERPGHGATAAFLRAAIDAGALVRE